MEIAILVFDGMTAIDVIGPYEVLASIPQTNVYFVSVSSGMKRIDTNVFSFSAEKSIEELPHPDILLIPGGNILPLLQNEAVLEWTRTAYKSSQWTLTTCTGVYLLGAAGLLQGRRVTVPWAGKDGLAPYGAIYVEETYVRDGKLITSVGGYAGTDMALSLACEIAGIETAQALQLALEYDPHPPFDTGVPKKATPALIERAKELTQYRYSLLAEKPAGELHLSTPSV